MRINIAMSFDRRYLLPCLISVKSILDKSDSEIKFHFGINQRNFPREMPPFFSEILLHWGVDYEIHLLPEHSFLKRVGHIRVEAFNKLMIRDKLELEHFWVDSDMICLSRPPFEEVLRSMPLGWIGMVAHLDMSKNGFNSSDPRERFNSGLISFGKSAKFDWLSYAISKDGALHFGDQEIFNMGFLSNVVPLDGSWNSDFTVSPERLLGGPYFAHFLGSQKPWHLMLFGKKRCVAAKCGFDQFWKAEEAFYSSIAHLRHVHRSLSFWRLRHFFSNLTLRGFLLLAISSANIFNPRFLSSTHPFIHRC